MSDLVERLRSVAYDRAGDGPSGPAYDPELLEVMTDAADEIERLRKEVAYLKSPDREFERDVLRAIAGMQK